MVPCCLDNQRRARSREGEGPGEVCVWVESKYRKEKRGRGGGGGGGEEGWCWEGGGSDQVGKKTLKQCGNVGQRRRERFRERGVIREYFI